MAVIVDDLITRYRLDGSQYRREAATVTAATRGNQAAFDSATRAQRGLSTALGMGAGIAAAFGAVVLSMTAGLGAFMVASGRQAAEFDALVKALEAVEGSAHGAKDAMKALFDIAKAPGAGPEDAVRGYLLLRQSGLSREFSEEAIKQFANMNARVGGGAKELLSLLRVASQISNKPFLQGDELLQFMENNLPAAQLLKARFGTSQPEDLRRKGLSGKDVLEGLVAEMAKVDRAGESAKNTMENLSIAVQQAMVAIGTGVNTALMPMAAEFTKVVEGLAGDGVLQEFGTMMADLANGFAEAMAGTGDMRDVLIELGAVAITVAEAVRNFWINLLEGLKFFEGFSPGLKLARAGLESLGGSGEAFKNLADQQKRLREAQKRRDERRGATEGAARAKDPAEELAEAQVRVLKEIEANTARALDLQRAALGGGDLGAMGVSPVQLGGLRRKGAGRDGGRLINLGIGFIAAETAKVGRLGPMAR